MSGDCCTPDTYPAHCTVDAATLHDLKEKLEDETDPFGEYIDQEWPPRDALDNVYPITFTESDLDSRGRLRDPNNTPYCPFTGNLEPRSDHPDWTFCNAPLDKWRLRFDDVRFCGRVTAQDGGDAETYCPSHKNREHVMQSAEELMQTGLFTESVDHLYARLSPWERLIGWGTFESLMGESNYEFGEESRVKEFDFADNGFLPDDADEDGVLEAKCAYPTQRVDAALHLFVAAMMSVQMIKVQPEIMRADTDDQDMMQQKRVSNAQLRSPTENDASQPWKTIESWEEHPLNLPFSRLIKDHPRLLERGGVDTDPDSETDGPSSDNLVFEIQADGNDIETDAGGTDPNALQDDPDDDYRGVTEEIEASASNDD